ncbi:MAG: glycosyltransferase family 39 protein [Chloroflexota bacterium]
MSIPPYLRNSGQRVRDFVQRHSQFVWFFLILCLGIFARVWEIRFLPSGLHQDEASIGMDAYYLLKYGLDRNGFSYPVHLVAWGSGQNALYAYLLMPFLALFGLKAVVIRLPNLILGILTLPVIYLIGKQIVDKKFGLFFMFCVAISPWHILLSRWGLESNILPFFFSVGFYCLLKSRDHLGWFIAANIFFAISLYAYGTAYAAIPIFFAFSIFIIIKFKWLSWKKLGAGFGILVLMGFPIFLFVIINLLKLETLHFGLVSIPRLPVLSRFEGLGAMFSGNSFLSTLRNYALAFFNLLITQDDLRSRNSLPPYGYFYPFASQLSLAGIIFLFRSLNKNREQKLFLLAWFLTSLILGMLQPVIINRINLIFIPIIFCAAYFIYWLHGHFQIALPLAVIALLIGFSLFTRDYHGPIYRQDIDKEFYAGLVPAIDFARKSSGPICVTNQKIYMPYIFVLFSEQTPPLEYLKQVTYVDPNEPLREVRSMGRYTFGTQNCNPAPGLSYILFEKEKIPVNGEYKKKIFGNYIVYTPQN